MAEKRVPVTLRVEPVPEPPDFFPSATPPDVSVYQGGVATYQVTYEPVAGFTGPVMLEVAGLPEGFIATFDINPLGVGQTAICAIDTTDLPVGEYALELVATA